MIAQVGSDLADAGALTALAVGLVAGLFAGIRLGVKWYRDAAAAAREDHRPPATPGDETG